MEKAQETKTAVVSRVPQNLWSHSLKSKIYHLYQKMDLEGTMKEKKPAWVNGLEDDQIGCDKDGTIFTELSKLLTCELNHLPIN